MLASRFAGIACGAVAVVVAFLAAAVPASASVIVDFSGNFVNYVNPPSYYAKLNGGSFSGTFTVPDELPVGDATASFTAFTVSLYDSSAALVFTFSDGTAGHYGHISGAYVPTYGGDIVDFFGPNSTYFQLVFSTPFTGTGSVSQSGSGSFSYTYAGSGDYAYVASATARVRPTPVPEAPAVLTLAAGLSIMLALGIAKRRPVAGQ